VGKKHRCKACQFKRLEERERKMVDSWLCLFYEDVWCPRSKVPEEKRLDSVCLICKYFAMFEREMEEEEAAEAEFVEAVWKDHDAYVRGEIR
jgi:hypothetical protein